MWIKINLLVLAAILGLILGSPIPNEPVAEEADVARSADSGQEASARHLHGGGFGGGFGGYYPGYGYPGYGFGYPSYGYYPRYPPYYGGYGYPFYGYPSLYPGFGYGYGGYPGLIG